MTPAPGSLRLLPIRSLVSDRSGPTDRIVHHNIWFRGHNNPRYVNLLPRLQRVDNYFVVCSEHRILRGIQFRAHRASNSARNRLLLAAAARRYRFAFVTDLEQIPHIRGTVVADVDDPLFTPDEVRLLQLPNVGAYVVTTEQARRRFVELGVSAPCHVISQGVSFDLLDRDRVDDIARRGQGVVVVGYVAAWLLNEVDRGGSGPLYNADHVLDMWDEIHRTVPNAELRLIGQASDRIRQRCAGRPDIVLFGRLSAADSLAQVANFDVALFPRRAEQGVSTVKVAEYMGLGVPTVAYDLEVTRMLRETGGGVMVSSAREFVEAVERLATDTTYRATVASAARKAGKAFDWTMLAARYEREVLDAYLR